MTKPYWRLPEAGPDDREDVPLHLVNDHEQIGNQLCSAFMEAGRIIGELEYKLERATYLQKSAEAQAENFLAQRNTWEEVAMKTLGRMARMIGRATKLGVKTDDI